MSQQSFRELGVSAPVADALAARSIHEPFRIQELVLPDALGGVDVLVRSPTGSGKTLAFALAIVEDEHTIGIISIRDVARWSTEEPA